jgi:predicted nuclease with RNAse H fold
MLEGEKLYRQLKVSYPLHAGAPLLPGGRVCFETFPHAVARALAGPSVTGKNKRKERPAILRQFGIILPERAGIDTVDAALCALTAHHMTAGTFKAYGDAESGLIVVPMGSLSL